MSFNFRNFAGALALLTASAVQVQAEDVTLKLAGILPGEHFGNQVILDMIAEIESAGVGITIKYFPSGQLGSGEELLDDAKFGNVDMVHANLYPQADQRLEFQGLPFLITTIDEMRANLLNPDSTYNVILGEILADHGLKLLAPIGEGLVGIVASRIPENVHEMGNKDMNMRVWSSQLAKLTIETLGYRVTTLSWAEVFPALQAGTVDAAMCCTPEWAYNTFAISDVGAGFIPLNAFIEASSIYMNADKFNAMTPEQQTVVQNAGIAAATSITNLAWDRSDEFVQKLRDKGYEIVEFTQEERDTMRTAVVEAVWPVAAEVIGQDVIDRLLANEG